MIQNAQVAGPCFMVETKMVLGISLSNLKKIKRAVEEWENCKALYGTIQEFKGIQISCISHSNYLINLSKLDN